MLTQLPCQVRGSLHIDVLCSRHVVSFAEQAVVRQFAATDLDGIRHLDSLYGLLLELRQRGHEGNVFPLQYGNWDSHQDMLAPDLPADNATHLPLFKASHHVHIILCSCNLHSDNRNYIDNTQSECVTDQ